MDQDFRAILDKVKQPRWNSDSIKKHAHWVKNARDSNGDSILHVAAAEGHEEAIFALIQAGCDVNALNDFGTSPLAVPAWKGHWDVVKRLIEAGADIHLKDSTGFSVIENLRLVKKENHVEQLLLLLENHAARK